MGQNGQPATADNSKIKAECKTGSDANQHLECAIVADIDSIQNYWAAELPNLGTRYAYVKTVWFSGQVQTGCGSADSGAGPFYCPADKLVYIDLSFYDQLKTDFGATGGPFVNAYVLAHEYGHHVQDLLGTEAKVRSRGACSLGGLRGGEGRDVRLQRHRAEPLVGDRRRRQTIFTAERHGAPAVVDAVRAAAAVLDRAAARQQRPYQRPPKEAQRFVPVRYQVV